MRKSIFDIVSENISIESEVERIDLMADEEKILVVDDYWQHTLFDFVDKYCFSSWPHRGHFIDVEDFLETAKFDEIREDAKYCIDDLLTFIEVVYNFWQLSYWKFFDNEKKFQLKWQGNYYHLKDVMDDVLQQYNHVVYINIKQKKVLVIEDKPEVTAAAEIMSTDELSLDIIKYNHRTLKGEIELKKKILLSLAAEIEPKRKQLHNINPKLEDDIFFMLNNLNIRHNNRSKKDKNYKEHVAKMKKDRLEKWYDELYQMFLIAFLLLDNVKRTEDVRDLKTKIVGGQA